MGIPEAQALFLPASAATRPAWKTRFALFRSPAWIFLPVAVAVRIWLTVDTRGIIEGDEALLGLQAESIVRGAHPIYFWGQPYLGSLEAHLVALIFWLVGPSTWALRAEPILLSLLLMWLTWKLAHALADLARLSDPARSWFVLFSLCVASLPPLYDLVIELRTYGGYIETFILMLWLLLSVLRLTQRWALAARREMILRWLGIGFLAGLGLWVYPLIIIALLAGIVWIAGYVVVEFAKLRQQRESQQKSHTPLRGLLLAPIALPAALVGFAPAIDWGLNNHWDNLRYLLTNSQGSSGLHLHTLEQVTLLYARCSLPRLIGGALPTDPGVTAAYPQLLTPELFFGGGCLLITSGLFALSWLWRPTPLVQLQRLVGLPLLFAGCCAAVFCTSGISATITIFGCGAKDLVGRYTTPLLLVLPFLFAAGITLIVLCFSERKRQLAMTEDAKPGPRAVFARLASPLYLGLLALILIYAGIEGFAYARTSPNYTMQTSGCTLAPADDAPLIAYMRQAHIRYAWASGWVGNPITFATNGSILVVDPRMAVGQGINRIPAYTSAVLHADRPSILLLADHNDPYPALLHLLDQAHITYRSARFASEPGFDLLIITPLNRSVAPAFGNNLAAHFGGC